LWNALHANVRRLTLRGDEEGLLGLVQAPRTDAEDEQFSERALAACALGSFPSDIVPRGAHLFSISHPPWSFREPTATGSLSSASR
jgi:hypothetical protein